MNNVVIVGAGHGGVELAFSLRERGFTGSISILDKSGFMPYERPPMSKTWISSDEGAEALHLRSPETFVSAKIDLKLECEVTGVDRERKILITNDGEFAYTWLVLALGSTPRELRIPGASLGGLHQLHTLEQASALRMELAGASKVAVIGAGFIGLEFASLAAKRGLSATVVETASRAMPRTASETTSHYMQARHAAMGTQFRFNATVQSLEGEMGRVQRIQLSDGTSVDADLVVQGIGANANGAWVDALGLAFDSGIIVDHSLRTTDPFVFAIGDCARFTDDEGVGTRLESVGNASDHARRVAATISVSEMPRPDVPWFWTQQAGVRLQMAGRIDRVEEWMVMGDMASDAFSVLGWRQQQLVYGESLNSAGDHVAVRKLLAETAPPTLTDLRPLNHLSLKAALKSLVAH